MKIMIIGYSGSGKSTLARKLGEIYRIPVLHLDKVNFISNWELRDRNECLAQVHDFMRTDSWVIEGNYSEFYQEKRLNEADNIIFLDSSRISSLYYAYKRYLQYKGKVREDVSEECHEKFDWKLMKWILFDGRSPKKHASYKKIAKIYAEKLVILKNHKEISQYIEDVLYYL